MHTWTFGAPRDVAHQQCGTLWVDKWVISVGLNGMMHHLDIETGAIIKTVHGHQGNITGLAVDAQSRRVWTCDTQGSLINLNLTGAKAHAQFVGDGHNKVGSVVCVVPFLRVVAHASLLRPGLRGRAGSLRLAKRAAHDRSRQRAALVFL